VVEAVEAAEAVRYLPVDAPAREPLIQGHGESLGELREVGHVGELLAVLVVVLELGVPEELVADEEAARAPAEYLAVEGGLLRRRRGLIQAQIRGETLVTEKAETRAVKFIAATAGHNVDGTT
jgi:hypothetical protein